MPEQNSMRLTAAVQVLSRTPQHAQCCGCVYEEGIHCSEFSEAVEALPGCLHITIPDAYHAPVNHSQSTSRPLQHQCTRHMARLMIKPKPGRPPPGLVLPSCLLRRRQSDNTSLIALGQSRRGAAPARSRPTVCRMPEAGRGLTSLRLTNC